jgi:hypothetical protein
VVLRRLEPYTTYKALMARSSQMMFSMAWSVLGLVAHGEWLGTVLSGLLTCAGVFMSG